MLAFGPLFFHTALEHSGCPLTERPGCPKDMMCLLSLTYDTRHWITVIYPQVTTIHFISIQTEDVFEAIEEEEEPDDESDKVSQHTEKEDIEEEEEEQIEEVHDRDPDIEGDEDGGIGNPAFDSHMSEQNHIDAA